jgi:hypothetical protein
MFERKIAGLLVIVSVLLLTGCSRQPRTAPFLHGPYREKYLIADQELGKLQFFISKDIVVQDQSFLEGGPARHGRVIVMRRGTPGVVTEAGSNWLRVSFEKGGPGATFVTDRSKDVDQYWLATEVEGRAGFYRIKELPEKVLIHQGTRYVVIDGADAYLRVDQSDLGKLIESRRHIGGRQTEQRR